MTEISDNYEAARLAILESGDNAFMKSAGEIAELVFSARGCPKRHLKVKMVKLYNILFAREVAP